MGAKHFICWGVHAVRSALTNAATDGLEMWLRDGGLSADLQELAELGRARGITVQQAPAKTLVRLTEGAVHQGIVLRRRFPRPLALDDYLAGIPSSPAKPLLLALDQVTDPQNFGACLRVADGAGADAVIVPRDLSAPTGLVFGAEGAGLRALTRKKCDLLARIPMAGSVASLNVSTAVAIGLFEAVRQRGGEA